MTAPKTYLRPCGLLWGKAAHEASAAGIAGPLAGGGIAFSAVEVMEREGAREWRSYRDLKASRDSTVSRLLQAIEQPRAPLCGFDFEAPLLMGIVNVTPDSFSDGGTHPEPESAIAHGRALAAAGAHILDVGGESTRPYSGPAPLDVERARALPVVEALAREGHCVSIDTRKSAIMREAAAAGASILNDVSALGHDPHSMDAARDLGLPVILMHAQGDPQTMQVDPRYDDVALDIYDLLEQRIAACEAAGIPREKIIADPGIGFGKTHAHNLELMSALALFHGLGVPLLVGASRKGFIGKLTGEPVAGKRVMGSVAAALAALAQGVQIVRVHDVVETAQAVAVWRAGMHAVLTELDRKNTTKQAGVFAP